MKNSATFNQNTNGAGNSKNFKTRALALSGILVAIGFVLHSVTPPIFFGVKPDFLLACMFMAVVTGGNIKNTITTGIVAGIVAALTTGFPGGQIPSVIDKLVSAVFVYYFVRMIPNSFSSAKKVSAFALITFLGTVVSGVVFLGSAMVIAGLPSGFGTLVVGIVLPTAVANTVFGALMYKLFLVKNKSKG